MDPTTIREQMLNTQHQVASHSKNPETLRKLSRAADPDTRYRLTQNSNTPWDVLNTLAHSPEAEVRVGVAANPTTEFPTLWRMSKDPMATVRWALAGNPTASFQLLRTLAHDQDGGVAANAEHYLQRRLAATRTTWSYDSRLAMMVPTVKPR